MRTISRVVMTTALLVPMVAGPVSAQNYRWDVGINGGYSWYRGMLGSDETGLPDGSAADDVKFEAGWLTGAQIGYWLTPRTGLRLNGTYTERPVVSANMSLLDPNERGDDFFNNVNLWSGSVDLLVRFRQPNTEWMGRETLPYLALGLGGKWVNPAGDYYTCTDAEEGKSWACQPFTPVEGTNGGTVVGNTFALGEQKVIMGLVGLGADVRLSPSFALRLEANDRIYKPQIYAAAPTADNTQWNLPNGDENVSQIVHEIGGQIGLHFLAGLARPQVAVVVPAPAPAPAPAPVTPAPAPAPREDAITVCVIDPTSAAGIRTQNAILVEGRDTMVMVNGTRTPLRSAVGQVMVARNADWYVRGQPLTLSIGADRLEYLTHQGAVVIEADRLAYLGTVNGYPVYANRDEVADVMGELNDVRRAQASNDLGKILGERRDLRDELEDVEFLYVPLETTGCVFQPLRMMEQVRKGK